MSGAVDIRGVDFDYPARPGQPGVAALRAVSFAAAPNEFLCIVGPSGCGKSTLLDLIDGLARPTAGTIAIDGRPVDGPGADRAMVFQQPGLLPWRSVVGNIGFALECAGLPRWQRDGNARERVARLVRLVGLAGFERFYPGALSGGMRQRVNLARALVLEPRILLMDEPFANLDAQTRDLMQVELLRIWREAGCTVVFVTHNIQEAVFLADRVIVIGKRPGTVKRIVPIDLPRPRDFAVRRLARFGELEQDIWEDIRHDISATS